jgi:8-oxo-dGTP pyrophosphatase MutT (NUDIX family)
MLRGGRTLPPDILYHATSERRIQKVVAAGALDVKGGRAVFLSRFEWQAWQVAHRQATDAAVLFIDASRARRDGVRFERNAQGLWQATSIPIRHVLNLREGFAEQVSAGGVPVWFGPDGPELALIRVHRRSGTTWEVAKGKLELGETPAQAGMREVCEEMGYPLELTVMRGLGAVRYGFTTPDGDPRLKTLHMFLFETPTRVETFAPAGGEGICEVGWFRPKEASRAVSHRSLRPLMRRVRWLLEAEDD